MSKPKGGAREGAGRKPKLIFQEKHWLKTRYEELMRERAKERATLRALSKQKEDDEENDGEDKYAALKDTWAHLNSLPLSERKGQDAKDYAKYASDIIGKQRFIKVGSGRGPLLESGEEKTAKDIRQQVADEANKNWKRDDISERDVRAACAEPFSDEDIVRNWLDKQS